MGKLVNDLSRFNETYPFLRVGGNDGHLAIKPDVKKYWQRVAKHIFDTPEGKHPLIYEVDNHAIILQVEDGSHQQIWAI